MPGLVEGVQSLIPASTCDCLQWVVLVGMYEETPASQR